MKKTVHAILKTNSKLNLDNSESQSKVKNDDQIDIELDKKYMIRNLKKERNRLSRKIKNLNRGLNVRKEIEDNDHRSDKLSLGEGESIKKLTCCKFLICYVIFVRSLSLFLKTIHVHTQIFFFNLFITEIKEISHNHIIKLSNLMFLKNIFKKNNNVHILDLKTITQYILNINQSEDKISQHIIKVTYLIMLVYMSLKLIINITNKVTHAKTLNHINKLRSNIKVKVGVKIIILVKKYILNVNTCELEMEGNNFFALAPSKLKINEKSTSSNENGALSRIENTVDFAGTYSEYNSKSCEATPKHKAPLTTI